MWRRGGDWWRLWTESRAVCAAAPVQTPPGLPSGDTPGAGSGAGVVGGETASPAAAWQPSADALPAAPSDAPFSPPSEYMSGIGFGAEVATRETGSAASTSAPSDSAVGADCGVVAAASAAVGAPPAGARWIVERGAGRAVERRWPVSRSGSAFQQRQCHPATPEYRPSAPSRGRWRRGRTCPVRRPPRGFPWPLSRPGCWRWRRTSCPGARREESSTRTAGAGAASPSYAPDSGTPALHHPARSRRTPIGAPRRRDWTIQDA